MDYLRIRKTLTLNKKILAYSDTGQGNVVVLLHGYLESLDIWNLFAEDLSKFYRVICFDIPGHGKSELLSEKQTMEDLSIQINNGLSFLGITTCFMIGHSMGGYLTLMFNHLFQERLSGFCLFHSHPFADSVEKRKNRIREMDMIREGRKNLIASINIPNTYATENVSVFADEIEKAKEIVAQTPDKGIVGCLHAMMTRPDLSESLANSSIPFLYIAGKKDNLIDFNTTIPKIKMPPNLQMIVLEKSGHMGFIEEKENAINQLLKFIELKIN